MTVGIDILAMQFIAMLAERKGPARIHLDPAGSSDISREWFRGAWSTVQRTTRLSPNKNESLADQKEQMRRLLTNFMTGKRRPSDFDRDWATLLTELMSVSKSRPLTLGMAQKLASVFVKYGYCVHHGIGKNIGLGAKMLETCEGVLFVPIDRVAIGKLRTIAPCSFMASKLGGESLQQADGRWVRWSSLQCWSTYMRFQEICRIEASKLRQSPLEFEMRNLWQIST